MYGIGPKEAAKYNLCDDKDSEFDHAARHSSRREAGFKEFSLNFSLAGDFDKQYTFNMFCL